MKMQTSLEFIILLSAVSMLSLFVITSYKTSIIGNEKILGSLLQNGTPSHNASAGAVAQNILMDFYMPTSSYIGKPNNMQFAIFGCGNGNFSISFHSTSITIPDNSLQSNLSGLGLYSLYFTPMYSGYDTINASGMISCGNLTRKISSSLITYAIVQNSAPSNGFPQVSALISGRNESVAYKIRSTSSLMGMEESNHCTERNVYGVLPDSAQCGIGSWGYSVFSEYCYTESNYYTMTYCVDPTPINYSIGMISQDSLLAYKFNLTISSGDFSAEGQISNSSNETMYSRGQAVGYAKVINISLLGNQPNAYFLIGKSKTNLTSPSAYQNYVQAENNMYATMGFYNGSYVSTDTQSMLEESVSAYIQALDTLLNTTESPVACRLMENTYACNPESPFMYLINSTLKGVGSNSTAEYLGSVVNVREG
ncbi:MAG: hypothetical protein KGH61_03280 [Candidatus Micrarchaeota archaeon]|nr:hypothetical protein [Candidatus Micrarchaeota archaeon]MDE1847946.1 hypothetical protein [Candidatus Micrarchaeota archaeon]MDE1864337.1 hypothetical protein [Candidatus Micrarchaeota archaeon]